MEARDGGEIGFGQVDEGRQKIAHQGLVVVLRMARRMATRGAKGCRAQPGLERGVGIEFRPFGRGGAPQLHQTT